MVCAIGTGEVVGALHPSPVIDELGLVETHCYPGGRYFIENPGWLSGGALRWLADTARVSDVGELDRLAAQVAPGSDGLVFLPALNGAMAPEWIASARGAFYGLTPAHGRGHLARAVMEGCAYAMRDVLARLVGMDVAVGAIRLLGGGARSQLWAQVRADVSGLPVEVPEVVDTSPLGAAALAAVAAGLFADVDAACARLGRIEATVEPESRNQDAYDEGYASYRRLFACLRPIFMAAAQASGATFPLEPGDMQRPEAHP
jgi:xylulokinase